MLNLFKTWWRKYFLNQELMILLLVLILGFSIIIILGSALAPIIASIIIAYLLAGWTDKLQKHLKFPKTFAYLFVYISFLTIFVSFFVIFLPLIWKQIASLLTEAPTMMQKAKSTLVILSQKYPRYFSEEQINAFIANTMKDIQTIGKTILTASLATIPTLINFFIYLVLIPLMVFFFLKDRAKITTWCIKFLPEKRNLLKKVWNEVDQQIDNYIEGKVTEIIIIGVITYIVLFLFDLKYAALLSTLVGLSVIIPYVGAIVVTIPIVIVAYLQWGYTPHFTYLVISYLIIQIFDGNILVPLLFSEAVNLHPIAILIAIIVFGSFWGFWGIFFAIPLATLVKAIINAWPDKEKYNNYKRKSRGPRKYFKYAK